MNQLDHPHKVSFSHLGIQGVDGAHKIFSELESRKPGTITSLRIAHNSLGDAGAVALFDFLAQADGDAYPLQALELEHCRIGNDSLRAIAGYLLGNTRLGRLTLHDDGITGNDEAGTVLFAEAINSSRLRHLTLSTNALTDAFATPFFSTLTSRTLSSLCMNGVGFTSSILAVHLASSTSPQYDIISLSGNSLSRPGVSAIIDALSEHQFWLTHLHIPGLWKAPKGEKHWTDEWAKLKRIYTRNLRLKPAIRDQARSLLRCARAIFLRPLASPTLPAELVLLTMVHLSPLLSYKQRERVLDYARDSSTLPPAYAQVHLASQAKERERFFVCVGCD